MAAGPSNVIELEGERGEGERGRGGERRGGREKKVKRRRGRVLYHFLKSKNAHH